MIPSDSKADAISQAGEIFLYILVSVGSERASNSLNLPSLAVPKSPKCTFRFALNKAEYSLLYKRRSYDPA